MNHYDLEELDRMLMSIKRYFINNHPFLKGADISPQQFYLMRTLFGKGKSTVSDLANELGLSISATTIALNRLVKQKYIHRYRDEADRRMVWIELSDETVHMITSKIEQRKHLINHLFENLSDEEETELIRLFRKLTSNIKLEVPE